MGVINLYRFLKGLLTVRNMRVCAYVRACVWLGVVCSLYLLNVSLCWPYEFTKLMACCAKNVPKSVSN